MLLKSLCFILMDFLSWQSYLHNTSHYRHRKILILIHAKDQKMAFQIHYILHHKFIATALAHFVGMAFCFVTSKCLLLSFFLPSNSQEVFIVSQKNPSQISFAALLSLFCMPVGRQPFTVFTLLDKSTRFFKVSEQGLAF